MKDLRIKVNKYFAEEFIRDVQRIQAYIGLLGSVRDVLNPYPNERSNPVNQALDTITSALYNQLSWKQGQILESVINGIVSPLNLKKMQRKNKNNITDAAYKVAKMIGFEGDLDQFAKALFGTEEDIAELLEEKKEESV